MGRGRRFSASRSGDAQDAETITTPALVVRLAYPDEQPGFAVQFFDACEETELQLEQLMLEALARGDAMPLDPEPHSEPH